MQITPEEIAETLAMVSKQLDVITAILYDRFPHFVRHNSCI